MSTQGEYFVLALKLQEQITNTLQEMKPAKPHKAINIMNEYEYNSISDKTNLYTFFFEIKQIVKLSDYNYVVSYTLHEHATTAMTNTHSIGMLMSLKRATTITQTKIKEGYLFSTQVLEDVIDIDDPLTKGNVDITIIKEIELDIDTYTDISDIDISDIENNTKIDK
ncbi:hypothetical protein [Romboutsia sp.]|uniref:hypothetical protein n=1 Tax=Romboutsia sp. TaxID=1965302 RepID=UPI003F2A0B24